MVAIATGRIILRASFFRFFLTLCNFLRNFSKIRKILDKFAYYFKSYSGNCSTFAESHFSGRVCLRCPISFPVCRIKEESFLRPWNDGIREKQHRHMFIVRS